MDVQFEDYLHNLVKDPEYHCPICGSIRYITDRGGNHEITLHCSSIAARFWDYPRGSSAETSAKSHWDESRRELYFRIEVDRFIAGDKPGSSQSAARGETPGAAATA